MAPCSIVMTVWLERALQAWIKSRPLGPHWEKASSRDVEPLSKAKEGRMGEAGEAARQTCDREETLPLAKQAMQDSTSIHKVHSSAMLTAEENYYNEMALAG